MEEQKPKVVDLYSRVVSARYDLTTKKITLTGVDTTGLVEDLVNESQLLVQEVTKYRNLLSQTELKVDELQTKLTALEKQIEEHEAKTTQHEKPKAKARKQTVKTESVTQ